jgi:type IV secretion system protein VirB8
MLWSGEAARSSYLAMIKPDSPDNPLARLPRQQTAQVQIRSVSLVEEGQALVRYDLVRQGDVGSRSTTASYVSVVRYRFRDRPLAEADRFINPLGFEVIRYRRDPEAAATAAVRP